MNKQEIIDRADELIKIAQSSRAERLHQNDVEQVLLGALSLVKYCYGENSKQFEILYGVKKTCGQVSYNSYEYQSKTNSIGVLNNLKSDINFGLLTSIEKQTAGEIYTDMLTLSKKLVDDNYKESSAVLACGAFEDCMKKIAQQNGINVADADLSEVINALKSKTIMQSVQANVAKSHVQLRNKAFHAQWDKIDIPEIKSLIAFLEEIILKNFNNAT
jgi:hypothetical protein